ncbi:MAG: DinB family protein [Microscillaceae bacterium]|jgi:hypothetical protein|nr:DinB family protein [Microscillaceae bacterium]
MLNVQEICQTYQELIEVYTQSLNKYAENQFNYKKADYIWSLGQMFEHLVITHNFFVYQTKNCLEQRKGQIGGDKTEIGENIYRYGTLPPIKITIPEKYRGLEPVAQTIAFYKGALTKMITEFQALAEPISQDAGEYKTFHARFGMLNALEWYKNAEMHLRHHLRQKQELEEFALNL